MDWRNSNRTRYVLAAAAALVCILILTAPIISVDAYVLRVDIAYTEFMEMVFSLGDGVSMANSLAGEFIGGFYKLDALRTCLMLFGIGMALGLVAVVLTLAFSLVPSVSETKCRRAAITATAVAGGMLLLILVGCIKAEFGFSALTFWYWLILAALAAMCSVGCRLQNLDSRSGKGSIKPVRGQRPTPPRWKPSSASGYLEGRSGMYTGARIPVVSGTVITIGRDPQVANVVILHQNADISRRHCTLRMDGQGSGYLITDYSSNGTVYSNPNIGGAALALPKNVETPLPRGTTIALGKNGNVFYLG